MTSAFSISWLAARSLAWGIALCAAVFHGVWDWPTSIGIGVGTFLGGGISVTCCRVLSARRGALLFSVICGLSLFLGVSLLRNLFAFTSPLAAQFSAWVVAAAGFVTAMEWIRRAGVFWRLLSVSLFVFACVRMLEPSTHGHLERPYWIAERVLEANLTPEKFWSSVACLLLPFAVILLRGDHPSVSAPRLARRVVAVLMWIALFGVVLLLPQPNKNQVQAPLPPRAPDAPPPPPPPEKIAMLHFAGFCRPSEFTDNAYLFYLHPREKISPPSREESAAATTRQIQLNSKIFLFSKSESIPALIGFRGGSPVAEFDQSRFQDAWEMNVLFPLDSDERHERLCAPQGRTLSKMEGVLWEGIFEESEIRPEKAAAKIKEALEKAGKLSERALIPPEKWNLEAFLLENTTGGNENFIGAAVELLELSGLEARVVKGLRYDPGTREAFKFKELILLSEANVSVWAEWRVPGGVWRPLAIHPETVLDDKPRPQQEDDLEKLLAREAGKVKTASSVSADQNLHAGWARLVGILVMVFLAVWMLAFLLEFWGSDEPEVVVFRWMRAVLRVVGYHCEIGECYAAFEERLGHRKPAAAAELSDVRRTVENLRWALKRPRPSRSEMQRRFIKFLTSIALQHRSVAAELTPQKTSHELR